MAQIEVRLKSGPRLIGDGHPTFIVAEMAANHNGSVSTALRMLEQAKRVGVDAVKFQKREPEVSIPIEQKAVQKETPWGSMPYVAYRKRLEFWKEYQEIDGWCGEHDLPWFASPWDLPSLKFLMLYEPFCIKVGSPSLTDRELIAACCGTGLPLILSTGMSTMQEIDGAVNRITKRVPLLLCHCVSAYPCPVEELNLRMVATLKRLYPQLPIGYSGHEVGLATTFAAVALGACYIERHFTLDRAMWGTDQAASVEPQGMAHLIKSIRSVEKALGDGVKRLTSLEQDAMKRLRRIPSGG